MYFIPFLPYILFSLLLLSIVTRCLHYSDIVLGILTKEIRTHTFLFYKLILKSIASSSIVRYIGEISSKPCTLLLFI